MVTNVPVWEIRIKNGIGSKAQMDPNSANMFVRVKMNILISTVGWVVRAEITQQCFVYFGSVLMPNLSTLSIKIGSFDVCP